jgi:hypothetical protein
VEVELMCDEVDLLAGGIGDVEPARVLTPKVGKLIRASLDDPVWLFDE